MTSRRVNGAQPAAAVHLQLKPAASVSRVLRTVARQTRGSRQRQHTEPDRRSSAPALARYVLACPETRASRLHAHACPRSSASRARGRHSTHQDAATGTEIDPFRKSIHRTSIELSTRKNAPKRDSRALVCGARCTPGALVRPCGPAMWGPHMGRPCGVAMWRFLRKKRHIADLL